MDCDNSLDMREIFAKFKANRIFPLSYEWRRENSRSHGQYTFLSGKTGTVFVPGFLYPHNKEYSFSGLQPKDVGLVLTCFENIKRFKTDWQHPGEVLSSSPEKQDWEWSYFPELVYLSGLRLKRGNPLLDLPNSCKIEAKFRGLDNHFYGFGSAKDKANFGLVLDNFSDYIFLAETINQNNGLGVYFKVQVSQ